jgi:hypothetical protein
MKFIKKINEDWSDDYVVDFFDHGFDLEETDNTISGKYKGDFVITSLNDWFAEMISKLTIEYKVLRTKTFFNQVTGNANFEVEVTPIDASEINVIIDGNVIKYSPLKITSIWTSSYNHLLQISIGGRTSVGVMKGLLINIQLDENDNPIKVNFTLGNKYSGIVVDNDNLKEILNLVESGKIKKSDDVSDDNILLFKETLSKYLNK